MENKSIKIINTLCETNIMSIPSVLKMLKVLNIDIIDEFKKAKKEELNQTKLITLFSNLSRSDVFSNKIYHDLINELIKKIDDEVLDKYKVNLYLLKEINLDKENIKRLAEKELDIVDFFRRIYKEKNIVNFKEGLNILLKKLIDLQTINPINYLEVIKTVANQSSYYNKNLITDLVNRKFSQNNIFNISITNEKEYRFIKKFNDNNGIKLNTNSLKEITDKVPYNDMKYRTFAINILISEGNLQYIENKFIQNKFKKEEIDFIKTNIEKNNLNQLINNKEKTDKKINKL